MWRAATTLRPLTPARHALYASQWPRLLSSSPPPQPDVTPDEARRLVRLVSVEALKRRLWDSGEEFVPYDALLDACQGAGVARSRDEARRFAGALDDAGVVLLFRDKAHLYPNKVADLVRGAVPLELTSEKDPRREELRQLQEKKDEIDRCAHSQVRRILCGGLGAFILQMGLFFRLTFWEFSWDVMEPIAFFTTTSGLLAGYSYFLVTSRDPTYQDFMERLFNSRQSKLFAKHAFDIDRYLKLQRHCSCPIYKLNAPTSPGHTSWRRPASTPASSSSPGAG